MKDFFLRFVRLGLGCEPDAFEWFKGSNSPFTVKDWQALETLANEQGLLGVMLDGVEKLPQELRPEKKAILQSIGQLLKSEQRYLAQEHAAVKMALLLHQHGIRTYVLKGAVVSECYPRPEHRRSVDLDCFLLSEKDSDDVWEEGNRLVEEAGFEVARGFYKNSTFRLPWLTVENHRFMTPFRGNVRLRQLEGLLQAMIAEDAGKDRFDGTWLYRPPVMVSALFLIEHAYSHFLHEGLTWRHVLDWAMFSIKHHEEIDWVSFDAFIDEFGFRKFYDSYVRLGRFLLGELAAGGLTFADRRMLADVWAPLDLHESFHGVKAKFQLAGNYWRAKWKYKIFTDVNWLYALFEWVSGAVFDKHPRLR